MEVGNENCVTWKQKRPAKFCDAIINNDTCTYPISIWVNLIDIISKAESMYYMIHLVMDEFCDPIMATGAGNVVTEVKKGINVPWDSPINNVCKQEIATDIRKNILLANKNNANKTRKLHVANSYFHAT